MYYIYNLLYIIYNNTHTHIFEDHRSRAPTTVFPFSRPKAPRPPDCTDTSFNRQVAPGFQEPLGAPSLAGHAVAQTRDPYSPAASQAACPLKPLHELFFKFPFST